MIKDLLKYLIIALIAGSLIIIFDGCCTHTQTIRIQYYDVVDGQFENREVVYVKCDTLNWGNARISYRDTFSLYIFGEKIK